MAIVVVLAVVATVLVLTHSLGASPAGSNSFGPGSARHLETALSSGDPGRVADVVVLGRQQTVRPRAAKAFARLGLRVDATSFLGRGHGTATVEATTDQPRRSRWLLYLTFVGGRWKVVATQPGTSSQTGASGAVGQS